MNEIRQQAAAWVVRLSEPSCGAAERAAFEAWRAQSARHEVAFERESAAWDAFDRLRALRPDSPFADPDLLKPPAEICMPSPRRAAGWRPATAQGTARKPARWAAAAALFAFVAAGIGAWSVLSAPAYATAVGERRVVVLPDNSRVELNTDSEIVVHYGRHLREVSLVRGEAMFEVAKDGRPFHVRAHDAQLDVTIAKMNVRLRPEGMSVLVNDGTIHVVPAHASTNDVYQVSTGQEAVYGDAGNSVHPLSPHEIDRRLAWRKSMIDLDGQSLAQAITEFNRYNRRHLVIADDSIANLHLGGYFSTNDLDGFVHALRTAFPIKAGVDDHDVITLMRAD